MQRGELKKKYGPTGQAQVTVGKRGIGVVMQDTRVKYEFPLDAAPKMPAGLTTALCKVSLSEDGTKIVSVSPWTEKVMCKVLSFGGDGKTLPVPKHKVGEQHSEAKGTTWKVDYFWFGVDMLITGPAKFAGLKVFSTMLYYDDKKGGFAPNEDRTTTLLVGKHRDVQKLESFLQASGVSGLDFPWSENLLPGLLSAILKADKEFAVNIVEGWPQTFEAIPQATQKKGAKR